MRKALASVFVFIVFFSLISALFGERGVLVNRGLKAEYESLKEQEMVKRAEVEVLRQDMRTEPAPGKGELIHSFNDDSPLDGQTVHEKEEEPAFGGISRGYCLASASVIALLHALVSAAITRFRRRGK